MSEVVSIHSNVVERNSKQIKEAADRVIEAFDDILRLSGLKHATVLAINAETGAVEYEINCVPVGEPS